jgi:GNAT superfamily N-acetyltransferase
VEHPEGASQDDILSFAQANYKPKAQDVEQVDVDELYFQAGGVERNLYITEVPFPEQAERKLKLYDEDLTFAQNVDQATFDIANQFNNQIANMGGATLNALGAGITKVASKITGKDYEYTRDWKETFRDTMNLLPGQVVLDEEPRTPYGYGGQALAEGATFLVPQIKVAQGLAATQSANKGVKLLREVSEQFVNEAAQNTGRFLAIEAGAALGAGAGRAAGEVYDLSPGGRFAVELLSGITGGFAGAGAAKIPTSLLKKTEGKTATEVLEMVSDGTIKYEELQWMPMMKEAAEPTPAPKKDYQIESVLDEYGEVDFDADEALRKIAKERDLGITSDREANTLVRNEDGEVIGGTFVSNDGDNYTFDVVVSEAAEGTGVGSKLLDDVIEMPYELREMNPDATMQVDVVSPKMKEMLERRGFEVKEEIGKDRWLMEPKDYDNVGKPKIAEPTPAPKPTMPGIVKETVEFNAAKAEIADKMVQKQAVDTANASKKVQTYLSTTTNPVMRGIVKLISALSPSTIAGRGIVFNIDDARNMVRAAEKTGAIVRRKVDKLIKKDPDAEEKVNAFLDGGEMDPSLEPIRNELEKFRDTLEPLQKLLIENLDDETIKSLPKATQEDLISTIKNSIEEKSYVSREYRMFTDRKYKPSVAQRAKAEQEIATGIMMSSDAGSMTMDRALEMAKNQLDDLESKSARVRLARAGGHVPRAFDGVLKSKRVIGPEERKYLGEITQPGEKIFGTLSRVSRLVAAQNQDIAISRVMLETGMATRGRRTPTQVEVPLSTTKGASGIYAEPEIVSAVTRLRMGDIVQKSNQPVARVLGELYNSLVGFSKATKVVLSPIAYPVQVYGNIAAALSSGIMPIGDVVRGMKLALSEFGTFRDVFSGKDTPAARAFLDDIEKMAKYGLNTQGVIASDVRDSFKRSISQKGSDLLLDVPSKLYSAPDIAFRYVVWKGNQKQLRKMYPNATQEQIEAAAARLTNDTYQQYDKVSPAVKFLSRIGLANPFVTFTAEKLRNMYNQGLYAGKMMRGDFGLDVGLDPATADVAAMRLQGGKRAASLAAVAGGSALLFNELNKSKGLDMESQKEFGETIAPNWDSSKQLVIIPDETGRKGTYFNPSYLVPELTATNAFYAGLRNKDFSSVVNYFVEELMGEGTFVFQAAAKIVLGFDENGKEVSLSADKLQQLKDKAKVFWEDVLEPGGMREIDKWERALQDVGDITERQLLMRLMGLRYNTWDAETSGTLKIRFANDAMREASGRFSSARDRKKLSPNQLEAVYQEMNDARRSQFDVIRQHYDNLGGGTWKYTDDERIQIMKDAGMSGTDILDIMDGTYTDLPKTKRLRTSDIYDDLEGSTNKEKLDSMKAVRKEDPGLYKRLIQHHKRMVQVDSRNLTPREKLISKLDVDKRVDYLINKGVLENRALLREYQRKGIATRGVLEALELKRRGY